MTSLYIGKLETSLEEFAHVGIESVDASVATSNDYHKKNDWLGQKLGNRRVLALLWGFTLRSFTLISLRTLYLLLSLLLLLIVCFAVNYRFVDLAE